MYQIKKIKHSQAEELSQLWIKSFKQAYVDTHSTENLQAYCTTNLSVEKAEKTLSNPEVECFFAYRQAEPLGVSVIHHHKCPLRTEEDFSELKQIYLLEKTYGTGLGKLLIEDSFSRMKAQHKNWVWLCVSNLNFRAQKFYNKLGFEAIGEGPTLVVGTDKLNSTIMIRKI